MPSINRRCSTSSRQKARKANAAKLPESIDLRLPAKGAWQASEHLLQTGIINRCKLLAGQWPELELIHAIPNGGSRSKSEAGRFKAEGVKAGVPDLLLPVARGDWHGLYIELKKAGGSPSSEQREWMSRLHAEGYRCILCNDPDTVMRVITAYLQKKKFKSKTPSDV